MTDLPDGVSVLPGLFDPALSVLLIVAVYVAGVVSGTVFGVYLAGRVVGNRLVAEAVDHG